MQSQSLINGFRLTDYAMLAAAAVLLALALWQALKGK